MSDYLRGQVLQQMINGLVSDRPLRERLAGVAGYLIPRISSSDPDDPVLKGQLWEIANRLTAIKAGPGDEGHIDATTKRLSDEEALSIAEAIVSLAFSEMRRAEKGE